jgi:hypothetical protein
MPPPNALHYPVCDSDIPDITGVTGGRHPTYCGPKCKPIAEKRRLRLCNCSVLPLRDRKPFTTRFAAVREPLLAGLQRFKGTNHDEPQRSTTSSVRGTPGVQDRIIRNQRDRSAGAPLHDRLNQINGCFYVLRCHGSGTAARVKQ